MGALVTWALPVAALLGIALWVRWDADRTTARMNATLAEGRKHLEQTDRGCWIPTSERLPEITWCGPFATYINPLDPLWGSYFGDDFDGVPVAEVAYWYDLPPTPEIKPKPRQGVA